MNNKGFVSKYGLFATIVVSVVGVGIFSYPSSMAKVIGTDGWFVTIIAGAIVFFLLSLIYRVVLKNNYNTFYNMLENNLGKIASKVFAFILCVYLITLVAFGMRIFSEVTKMYLLEQTPTEFILLVMILTGIYLVRSEVSALVKFNEIALAAMFIPVIIILAFATRGGKLTNVLPLLQSKPDEYIRGLVSATYAFAGFEIAYLILPFMKDKDGIRKTLFKSTLFITFFYVVVTILSLMFFTKEYTQNLIWPTINLIRSVMIPGAFIERWEGIVMFLWVLYYFTTFVNLYYFSGDIIKEAFNLHDIKLSSLILAPVIYIVALYPQNIAELYYTSDKITPIMSIFSYIVLPLILLISRGSKERGKKKK
ncbi:endospore germination permease [Clostridium sp. SYSU_GA19001]|uniref:GerAB/ArcD/ProY family transporter n=1 Tax=Clostridium caldaquaticum TaxID=2940653 RepID=UPI002076FB03|nr:endospore germination permease [Clostridium caldaquaticum]MCM8709708.1 endospore germination permease [Clostridium caldaquaticum]